MSALASTSPVPVAGVLGGLASTSHWSSIALDAPVMAATAERYLHQIDSVLMQHTVINADGALRIFTRYLTELCPTVTAFVAVTRPIIEDFKLWLQTQTSSRGGPWSRSTIRQRLGTLRVFFDRIIEWDWPDAPARNPIFSSDLPIEDRPLPKFLDDAQAAQLMRAALDETPARRLVIEVMMRTGVRVGELCSLRADAVTRIGDGWWLHVQLGKLHTDRYVPLHPQLVDLLADWKTTQPENRTGRLLFNKHGDPFNQASVTRIIKAAAKRAGIGHVHPHQLRHTLATQAINRGMRLEAVAAMLGHRSLKMTLVYARIANRTVADEYHAVSQQVDALYDDTMPANLEGPNMRRLRADHHRMLGNGFCNRPPELDCAFETICEGCGFFQTNVTFLPTLKRQRDHATDHDQPGRAQLFTNLVTRAATTR